MKKQTETEDIISIDLDEEKEKEEKKKQEKEKKQEIEIKAGDLYIKIPADRSRIREAIEFLEIFEKQLIQKYQAEILSKQPIEQILPQVKPATPPFPQQQIAQENTTIVNGHKTYDKCPLCNGKIKKKKIEMASDGMKQTIVCKNRRCRWQHTFLIKM